MVVPSKRLLQLAELVLPGRPMADIGTDHALLPAWLRYHDQVPFAIGSDIHRAPLEHARARLDPFAIDGLDLRQGSGLRTLAPGEVATIVIAGMGGDRIQSIVDDAPDVAHSATRLVLQPNTRWTATRRWLQRRRLPLIDERLVAERDHVYVCLIVEPGGPLGEPWTQADAVLGPHLRRRPDPLFERWRRQRVESLRRANRRAREAGDEAALRRIDAELDVLSG